MPRTTTCSRRWAGSSPGLLGDSLGARNLVPDLVLHGSMRRHRETAEATLERAGWNGVEVLEDQGWNEFDHLGMLAAEPVPFGDREPSKAEFQAWFETATDRWTSGSPTRTTPRASPSSGSA